jgi:hypothetical protein
MPVSRRKKPQPSESPQANLARFLLLVDILGNNSEFYFMIDSDLPNCADLLGKEILTQAKALGLPPLTLSDFQSRLSRLDVTTLSSPALRLKHLFVRRRMLTRSRSRRRNNAAVHTGLLPAPSSGLPVIRLHRRPVGSEYPPPKHFVLERSDLPIPPAPQLKDRSCNHCVDYHVLDESRLSYTCGAEESATFVDHETGEIIATVTRDLAKGPFPLIQQWGVDTITASLPRRTLSQRNCPGKLARVGVSDGARSRRLFGWVRNLLSRYRNASDAAEHEQQISSLFGFFYELVRGQIRWVAEQYEAVMSSVGLPQLDKNNLGIFTLPFSNPVTFKGYPLAPPEGYIAMNFCKQIHYDNHWFGCPWGCYWNVLRKQSEGKVGIESGASFFISNYGLRIVNASNTCVVWNVSLWHGTGWYYNGLCHIGIAILLSKTTQTAWVKYQAKLERQELKDEELLWFNEDESDVE